MTSNRLQERDWRMLLGRIKAGKCTPFLGAGACYGVLPLGGDIARDWASEHRYPLDDQSDLARVAQFLAVRYDPMFPKDEILKYFVASGEPDYSAEDEPHSVLADLPLPIYLTTNYDDFMVKALRRRGKQPQRDFCRWNRFVQDRPSVFEATPAYDPTFVNPVVFHLHGHTGVPESMVLTEDDYLDYLVNVSRDQQLLPPQIQRALTGSSLLFVGYSLADWSFRVLFRGLITSTEPSLRRISVTVQLPPPSPDMPREDQERIQAYLDDYFDRIQMRVYWGTAREFMSELRERWRSFQNGV